MPGGFKIWMSRNYFSDMAGLRTDIYHDIRLYGSELSQMTGKEIEQNVAIKTL